MGGNLTLFRLVLDGIAAILTLAFKLLTWFEHVHQLLPLPKDLQFKGWAFTALAIILGIWMAIRIRSAKPGESHWNWIIWFLMLGLILFPFLFWMVELAWKHWPQTLAHFVYLWIFPLIYGCTFGAVTAALSLVLNDLAASFGWLKQSNAERQR